MVHKHSRDHKQSHFQGQTKRCCCVYLFKLDSAAPGQGPFTVWVLSFKLCTVKAIKFLSECKCVPAEKEAGDVTKTLTSRLFFFFFLTFGLHEHLLKGAAEAEITRILWLLQSLLSAVTNKNIDFLGA